MYWSHNPHSLLDHYTFNIQFQVNMFLYFWNKSTRLVNEVTVFVVFLPDLNKVNFMKIVFSIGKLRGFFYSQYLNVFAPNCGCVRLDFVRMNMD